MVRADCGTRLTGWPSRAEGRTREKETLLVQGGWKNKKGEGKLALIESSQFRGPKSWLVEDSGRGLGEDVGDVVHERPEHDESLGG